MTTLLLKKPFEETETDNFPRKRAKLTGEFNCAVEAQQDQRSLKRQRLDDIYEENLEFLQKSIENNIGEQLLIKKRKKETSVPLYDEETVRTMITVALETQKEQLFATFIEQNLEDLAHYEQVINFMFNRHANETESLAGSYIG